MLRNIKLYFCLLLCIIIITIFAYPNNASEILVLNNSFIIAEAGVQEDFPTTCAAGTEVDDFAGEEGRRLLLYNVSDASPGTLHTVILQLYITIEGNQLFNISRTPDSNYRGCSITWNNQSATRGPVHYSVSESSAGAAFRNFTLVNTDVLDNDNLSLIFTTNGTDLIYWDLSSGSNPPVLYINHTPDSCIAPGGRDWIIDMSDNCNITSNVDLTGYNINLTNTGNLYINATVTTKNLNNVGSGMSIWMQQIGFLNLTG